MLKAAHSDSEPSAYLVLDANLPDSNTQFHRAVYSP